MDSLIDRLTRESPVLTDGAWGTELQSRGLCPGEIPDAWNLAHPDRVLEVARAYVEAGSRIVLTNTFSANRVRLAESPLAGRAPEINGAGVAISRQAAGTRAFVFASIGPSGKMLVGGDVTPDELRAAYAEQADALASGGADGLVVETMTDLDEAQIATKAAVATGLPVVACMVFDSGRERDRTLMGVTLEQAAAALIEAGAAVIGANCGQGIAGFVKICRRLRAATDRPIWIKANAGLPEWVEGRAVYRTTPDEFAGYISDLVAAGANFLGGCCGTNPEFIRSIRRAL